MLTARFVRPAHNLSNAESFCHVPQDSIDLSPLGFEQAQAFASDYPEAPDMIVSSAYLRAQRLANLLGAECPSSQREIWPIQESSFLSASAWLGATFVQRNNFFLEYFRRADPDYREGTGAETFVEFVGRARNCLRDLHQLRSQHKFRSVLLVSHEGFMTAIKLLVSNPRFEATSMGMGHFSRELSRHCIEPCTGFELHLTDKATLLPNPVFCS